MNLQEQIESILQEGVSQLHFPGAHYAIVYGDGKVVSGHVGFKQTEPIVEALHGNEIYDVASLTKVISTTTLIMKLIDRKQLLFTTKVSEILPQFHHTEITIADLLTHSSGLPADIPRASTLRNKDDVLSYIYSVDVIYPRGTKIIYSDIGFILLGLIAQKITKKTLPELAKDWIFDPLDMSDTSYHPVAKRCAPTEYREDTVYQGYLQGLVHDEKSFAMQ